MFLTFLRLTGFFLAFHISLKHGLRINESSCMFVAGRDGHTADAEHWWQQRQHIYIVYVSPHAPCPWFGMPAMFTAMAAEVR